MNEIELWEQEISLNNHINFLLESDIDEIFLESINIGETIKKIINKLLQIMHKIINWIKNIINKIKDGIKKFISKSIKEDSNEENKETQQTNIFTVYIPEAKQNDFEKCMKISEGKNLINSDTYIDTWIKDILGNKGFRNNRYLVNKNRSEDGYFDDHYMRFDLDRINNDLSDCLTSLDGVKEWDRLKSNNYTDTNKTKVNFKNVVSLMEKTEKDAEKFENALEEIEKLYDDLSEKDKNDDDLKKDYPKITKYCQLHTKYFNFRTTIMKTFLNSVGLDIKKAKQTNTDSHKQFDIENKHIVSNYKNDHYDEHDRYIKRKERGNVYEHVYIKTQEDFDKIMDLMKELKEYNENKDWSSYRKSWNEIMKIVKAPYGGKINIAYEGLQRFTNGANYADFTYLKQNYRKIPIGNKTLYHTSRDHDLTELTPTCIINGGKRYCPEPVVYAHLSTIASRYHKAVETDRGVRVYKIISPVDYVYQDTEIKIGSATIIRTDKPLKVKMLTQEEFDYLDNGNGKK